MEGLKNELVRIKTRDGLELQGLLFEPEKAAKKAFIHLHGWTGNFYENEFVEHMAKEAASKGIAFLTFNTRGAGHVQEFLRKKNGKTGYVKIGGSLERFEDCVLDIGAAIGFLEKIGYKEFIMQGHSTGCQKAVYYKWKTKDARVKGIILLEPSDDPAITAKMLGARYREAMQIARKRIAEGKENAPMPEWVPFGVMLSAQKFLSIADPEAIEGRLFHYSGEMKEAQELDCPVLAIFGSRSDYTKNPEKALEILKAKIKKCDTRLIRNSNHWFFGHEQELGKAVAEWAEKKMS
jgi:pimeloyl-ACP methyl ester carboxylesterase